MVTRRRFLTTAAAGVLGLAGVRRVWANTALDLGGVRIDVVSDGHLVLPANFLFEGLPADEVRPILERYGVPAEGEVERPCNLTLLRDGERTILFDAGSGGNFMPSAGKIDEALAALDLDPSEITHVVFTHGHPDHLWGVLDDFGDLMFAEAAHLIGRKERDYWMAPETLETIEEERKAFVVGAQNRLPEIEGVAELFDAGQEILPGVRARETYGHTPGHVSFEIAGGDGRSVLVVGDAIANRHLAFERPDLPSGTDHQPEIAAATRKALLEELAETQMPLIGFHLPYPGIGRAERSGETYVFVPEETS